MTSTLILLRHGQSQANADGLFTGLIDSPLTCAGEGEAHRAAQLMAAAGLMPDRVFTSPLTRALESARIVAQDLAYPGSIRTDWRLAERNYGALSGQTKQQVYAEAGPELFRAWRRSVDIAPPAMSRSQRRTLLGKAPAFLRHTESLRHVCLRVGRFIDNQLDPLPPGTTSLVVAHGNSLRAFCMILDGLSHREVEDLNLPTGQPLIYRLGEAGYPSVRGGEYLDPERAHAAAQIIAEQGGT